MNEILSKERFLSATTLPQERVHVAALGGDAIVRGMTGAERDAFEASLVIGKGKGRDVSTTNIRAKLVARCLVNEQGERLFTDADADALGLIRVDVLSPLFAIAQKLSGVSDEDIDELGKRSASASSDTSSSNSRSN